MDWNEIMLNGMFRTYRSINEALSEYSPFTIDERYKQLYEDKMTLKHYLESKVPAWKGYL